MEYEQKYVDSKTDISTALIEIQAMLRVELEHWFRTDNSVTSDHIANYDAALELLVTFVRERDVNAFILVFQKYRITIDGIRKCFYNSGSNVKEKRNRAQRLFANVCKKMVGTTSSLSPVVLCHSYILGLLTKDSLKAMAKELKFGEQDAKEFFEGQYRDALKGVEEDDLEYVSVIHSTAVFKIKETSTIC